MNKQSGLGRGRGTVVADDAWWKNNTKVMDAEMLAIVIFILLLLLEFLGTKGHGEWRKLRYGPPENLTELEIMFQNIAVDGSSSCIPGELISERYECDVGEGSPIHSLKRPSSTRETKSHMVKVMKGIVGTMQEHSIATQKALREDFLTEEVQHCMRLAVESGAIEGTDGHFMVGRLFVKAGHRAVFLTLTTKEARLDWLKRWCNEKNK